MLFSPRIGLKPLAQLSRRLGTSLEAGIDARKVWQREAERAHGTLRSKLEQINTLVAGGESTHEALASTGKYFPELFRELTNVGEQSGRLSEVYRRMADQYDHQVEIRRKFLASISWPLFQLMVAIFIVAFLIWFMGFAASMNGGQTIDLLGLGLVGNRGLAIYFSCVGAAAVVVYLLIEILRRGGPWSNLVQRIAWRVPFLGGAVQSLALSRFTWSLFMTSEAGMDLRKALPLSFRATRAPDLIGQSDAVVAAIQRGREVNEALRDTKLFPADFLDAVEVGEHSGQLPETLELLSRHQEESAKTAFSVLGRIAGFAVWAAVAGVMIAVIFRLFSSYVGMIDKAMKG